MEISVKDQQTFTIEQLRERLKPFNALDIIVEVQETLRDEWRDLTHTQVKALELQKDIQFQKLRYAIPELKAVEHSFNDSKSKVHFHINMGQPDGKKDQLDS